jgi:hypothetical protein
MSDEIPTFGGREEIEGGTDERDDLLKGSRPCGAQERFQFGEGELDRIEVRTVGREKSEVRARRFNRGSDLRVFVHREVVQDHHIAGAEGRHQHLVDIGLKAGLVDRAIEHGWRGQSLRAQGDHDGVRLPFTVRRVVVEAGAARTPAVAAEQVRRHPALIEEDVLLRVMQR